MSDKNCIRLANHIGSGQVEIPKKRWEGNLNLSKKGKKVKQSRYRPGVAQKVPGN
jgi:hypothetical protein